MVGLVSYAKPKFVLIRISTSLYWRAIIGNAKPGFRLNQKYNGTKNNRLEDITINNVNSDGSESDSNDIEQQEKEGSEEEEFTDVNEKEVIKEEEIIPIIQKDI